MDDAQSHPQFVAVLIYEQGPQSRCIEPRAYQVAHPEIAYRLALADGSEQRYGRTFLGLSHLEETQEEVEPIARTEQGDARELIVAKDKLQAFNDPKWQGQPPTEEEIRAALAEPEFLVNIEGLDDIPWYTLSHAYGSASDVPKDIHRLTSSDPEYRENALWQLSGSIYHQGTLYSATASAMPFILRILANEALPDRGPLSGLLREIAESAAADPARIEKAWRWRADNFGETYRLPTAQMAAEEIADNQAVFDSLNDHLALIQKLSGDADTELAENAKAAMDLLIAAKSR